MQIFNTQVFNLLVFFDLDEDQTSYAIWVYLLAWLVVLTFYRVIIWVNAFIGCMKDLQYFAYWTICLVSSDHIISYLVCIYLLHSICNNQFETILIWLLVFRHSKLKCSEVWTFWNLLVFLDVRVIVFETFKHELLELTCTFG